MKKNEIDYEIEKLKTRRLELTNKMKIVQDFDEKDQLEMLVKRIDGQIQVLEKFRIKTQ